MKFSNEAKTLGTVSNWFKIYFQIRPSDSSIASFYRQNFVSKASLSILLLANRKVAMGQFKWTEIIDRISTQSTILIDHIKDEIDFPTWSENGPCSETCSSNKTKHEYFIHDNKVMTV